MSDSFDPDLCRALSGFKCFSKIVSKGHEKKRCNVDFFCWGGGGGGGCGRPTASSHNHTFPGEA